MVGESLATRSVIEALAATSPDIEVWWDSSPLIYPNWIQETVAKIADPARREVVEAQLERLLNTKNPEASVIVGCTTNPPLTLQAIQKDPALFEPWIDEQARKNPRITARELFWLTYQHVVALGAAEFRGLFEQSGHKRGYLSGQVDPRVLQDTDEMVRQGTQMNRANRNVMVKMPGTKEGIEGIRRLASQGIPTNATLTFVLPQLILVAEAVKAGIAEARKNGVDLSKWRAVCTMMLGRFEDAKEFRRQAEARGIELTESDLRWAGTAVMKKAYRIYKERGYDTKLLAASMRPGPKVDGKLRVRHVEELLGGDVVLTVFPNIFEALVFSYEPEEMTPHIDGEVPAEVLEKLLKVPYFAAAYDEHGIAPEDFITHGAVVETATSFAQATTDLEAYCASRIAAVR
jgi:transaldolase